MNTTLSCDAPSSQPLSPRDRAQLYHFLELAFAHPGEDGHAYFSEESTERDFQGRYKGVGQAGGILDQKGETAASQFFAGIRRMSFEDAEAAHISLFTNNYPHLPCPPYGSLFTTVDSDKRLAEMLAIKEFYQSHGVDMSETFDDLPDHLCVELEFLQLLCFREGEAVDRSDAELLAGVRDAQAEFLDRFLLKFTDCLADIAIKLVPENPYSHLLDSMRYLVHVHRSQLDAANQSAIPGSPS
ncbi:MULTISPECIES: molecular chaperone TorD family protein [unclassified Acidovorax]|uniref:molecular chaperone TorD family protein n=1 Tax=unclassified Acidovorax TaxID=2684926 RepID=UPI000B3FB333|nr:MULTISPECIES: molecular chaperone TorD family protein [unclassified Acidovorax]